MLPGFLSNSLTLPATGDFTAASTLRAIVLVTQNIIVTGLVTGENSLGQFVPLTSVNVRMIDTANGDEFQSGNTNSSGYYSFEFQPIRPSLFNLVVAPQDYFPNTTAVDLRTVLGGGFTIRIDVQLRLILLGNLTGTVRTASGTVAQGVNVTVQDAIGIYKSAITSILGVYRIDNLYYGNASILATPPASQATAIPTADSVTIVANSIVTRDITLRQATGFISVRIQDASGNGLSNKKVQIVSGPPGAPTDAFEVPANTDVFTLQGLPPGTYKIQCSTTIPIYVGTTNATPDNINVVVQQTSTATCTFNNAKKK